MHTVWYVMVPKLLPPMKDCWINWPLSFFCCGPSCCKGICWYLSTFLLRSLLPIKFARHHHKRHHSKCWGQAKLQCLDACVMENYTSCLSLSTIVTGKRQQQGWGDAQVAYDAISITNVRRGVYPSPSFTATTTAWLWCLKDSLKSLHSSFWSNIDQQQMSSNRRVQNAGACRIDQFAHQACIPCRCRIRPAGSGYSAPWRVLVRTFLALSVYLLQHSCWNSITRRIPGW